MVPLEAAEQSFGALTESNDFVGPRTPTAASTIPSRPAGEGELQHQVEEPTLSGHRVNVPFGHITDETLDLIRASISITEVISQ